MAKKKTAPAVIPPQPAASYKEIGSGITKRSVPTFPGRTLPEVIVALHSAAPLPDTPDFAVKIAADVLNKHGIEYRPDGTYRTEDGRAHNLIFYVEAIGHRAYESPVWYAATIFQFWFHMQDAIVEGEAKSAAGLGFEIGRIYAEANLKFRWERDALLGQRDRQTRRRGGQTTGQRTRVAAAERNAGILIENERLLPKHPKVRERAAIIAEKTKKPVDTIRGILKRSK